MPITELQPIALPPVPTLLKEQLQKTQEGADALKNTKPKNVSRRGPIRLVNTARDIRKKVIIY